MEAARRAGAALARRATAPGRHDDTEQVAPDCGLAPAQLADLVRPTAPPDGPRAPALRFGEPRVTALLRALCDFHWTIDGVRHRELRPVVARYLGTSYGSSQMTYDLRRLVRKRLLQRVDGTQGYMLTPYGRRVALFLTKVHDRVLRPGLRALDLSITSRTPPPLRAAAAGLDRAVDDFINRRGQAGRLTNLDRFVQFLTVQAQLATPAWGSNIRPRAAGRPTLDFQRANRRSAALGSKTGEFEYLVIGAGSAGCVVAARLSEDPENRVLLLEAGGPDDHPDVQDPGRWPFLFYGELDWGYSTTPQANAAGRVIHCPRGRMLGGCHSHNASAWVRGHPADFDHWAYQGNSGWDWASVLPIFKRIEDWHGPSSDLRGVGGPMYVAPPEHVGPIAAAFVGAGREVGLPVLDDINGPSMEGIGYFNFTIKNGRRFSVASAYLRPALSRPNLTVVTGAETQRLLFEGDRCSGAEYARGGKPEQVRATHEVVLSAGAVGSPRVLLLSGVGPAAELAALGITPRADRPGVGKNLQDHPLLGGIAYELRGPVPPVVNNGAEATLWWRSRPGLYSPDIQPVVIEFPFATPELANRLPEHAFVIAPSVVASRGSVTLTSADPAETPAIDMGYLQQAADLDALLCAIELCRGIGAAKAFDGLRKREVMPGPLDRAAMTAWIRQSVTTYFHPTSSCRMGLDDLAVVDPELRVYGVLACASPMRPSCPPSPRAIRTLPAS